MFEDIYGHPERTIEQIEALLTQACIEALKERHGITAERVEEIRLKVLAKIKKEQEK